MELLETERLINWNELNAGIVHICFLVDNVQEEFDRIKELGYTKFKLKNGEAIYKVENNCLCKIKAPEGTEIEMRDRELWKNTYYQLLYLYFFLELVLV